MLFPAWLKSPNKLQGFKLMPLDPRKGKQSKPQSPPKRMTPKHLRTCLPCVNIVWIRYIEVYLCLNLVCFCGQMPYHLNKKTTLIFCPNVLIKMSFVTSVSQKHSFHSLVFSEGPFSLLVHKSSHVHLKVHLKIMWLLKLIQHGLGFQHSS